MKPNTDLRSSFWEMTDIAKMNEKYRIDQNLKSLKFLPLETLKKIFIQYRFFTHYYISDLAILVSKLPFGQLKSILAEILDEELGNGNSDHAHPKLYDDFLISVGISQDRLDQADSTCIENLENIQKSLLNKSWAYAVGLRGMGGECLCQIYLSTMYDYFSENSEIISKKNHIKWDFWDIHIGEVDLHHQKIVRAAINEILVSNPETAADLMEGYLESKHAWDQFWQHIFKAANAQNRIFNANTQ